VSAAKTAEPIEMSFGLWTRGWAKDACIRSGALWREKANTTEPSMCGGDAALSNYFDHLLQSRQRRLTEQNVAHLLAPEV